MPREQPAELPMAAVPPPREANVTGFTPTPAGLAQEELTEDLLDRIEMIGEEEAAGWSVSRRAASGISPAMRYLHCSRTIHQLVTDRNRVVAIYLAVASLLWTASTALLNAKPHADLIVPLATLQRACVPVTLGVMTLFAFLTGLILVRTRIGLIYEVAKMNVMLGLPPGRVQRLNFLSIFFLMHLTVSLAGGGSALLFLYHLAVYWSWPWPMAWSLLGGLLVTAGLIACYVATILMTTTDAKLQRAVAS